MTTKCASSSLSEWSTRKDTRPGSSTTGMRHTSSELGYSNDGASKCGNYGNGSTYSHPPPASTMCNNHNPHATSHYPTPTYVPPNPLSFTPLTHNHLHLNQLHHVTTLENHESNTDEQLELELMYEKWGCEPYKLKHHINGVHKCRQPNVHTTFSPPPILHMCNIFDMNQQGHTPSPITKPVPFKTYEDHTRPLYIEYGMQTEEHEPWEFRVVLPCF